MSHVHSRRGRNWYTAMGAMFLIMAAIVMIRQLLLWGPEFVFDFLVSPEFTSEKISAAMAGAGGALVAKGLFRYDGGRVP